MTVGPTKLIAAVSLLLPRARARACVECCESLLGQNIRSQAFAVINCDETPQKTKQRIRQIEEAGVDVDPVCFIPHDWCGPEQYVNERSGWTAEDINSLTGVRSI